MSPTELKFEIPDLIKEHMEEILAKGLAACRSLKLCLTYTYPQYKMNHIYYFFVIKDAAGECPRIRMIMEHFSSKLEKFSWISDIPFFYAPLDPDFGSSEFRIPRWECSGRAQGCMVWETSKCDTNEAAGTLTWTKN
jgi:uncharacterized protein YdhG (YjbR/CyaY superfamily)